ncbi:alpha/beta hydrolase family protein [Chloroflexota bacterium]
MKTILPYGSWKSPITTEMVAANSININEIKCDGDSVYWLENRPEESGRTVIMQYSSDGEVKNILPAGFNVRNRVHEYGGGSYTVFEGNLYFCNYEDQRIYSMKPGGEPEAITPAGKLRYADLEFDSVRQRIICVCEEHDQDENKVINSIVSISLDKDRSMETLIFGNDFYSNPRIGPDGSKMCWLAWDHPNMPWDGCELWMGSFDENGTINKPACLVGSKDESIFQPEWSPSGSLHFISDRSGWWNPYCYKEEEIIQLFEQEAEYGLPQWVFGLSTYGFSGDSKLVCSINLSGKSELILLDSEQTKTATIDRSYCGYSSIEVCDHLLYFVGYSEDHPAELVCLNLETSKKSIIQKTSALKLDDEDISIPTEIRFPSMNQLSYGNYYSPKNAAIKGSADEKPPLIVMIHGGPTLSTSMSLSMKIQYWTSRGFAVLDVNYSGSTGYGRTYRQRLNGQWGVLDVEDCINGANHLAEKELVDNKRMSISGGSAGGFTALCALTFHDVFSAGVSRYGISSLKILASDDHKFESHYLESLVGPYNESEDLLIERSPINFIHNISVPILIMQGSEDKVVPQSQSDELFHILKKKQLPVAYVLFEGEQHGFRKAETISRALEIEFYFYSQLFGFALPENIPPIKIWNMGK